MSDVFPRCQIIPLPDHQASLQIDGTERLRWHTGPTYPRPFFYPFNGPSGSTLTRMGHPGAANHDHHRSVWFAHAKVLGIDFWSDRTDARIRQNRWLVYDDGDDKAMLAATLGWYDGHDPAALLEQIMIGILRPGPKEGETLLELQSEFLPTAESLEFQKTNFGFLAVRVAKSIAEYFGGGRLTNSEGLQGEKDAEGEPNIFGQRARWMDYSGPAQKPVETRSAVAPRPESLTEGITYFDHPSNPGYPNHWHVREDGWMGASICMNGPIQTTREDPLRLRFLLHAHSGAVDADRADEIAGEFTTWPQFDVIRSSKRHRQYEIVVAR